MVRIIDLLSHRGIQARRVSSSKGGEWASACPGCGGDYAGRKDKSDRFRIWPEEHEGTGAYWCRQCRCGGDNIQFLRDFEGLSFREACERVGRQVQERYPVGRAPSLPPDGKWDPRTNAAPEEIWRQKAAIMAGWCFDRLFETPAELVWLQQERGLTDDTICAFGLGWNSGENGKDLFRSRESWGLPQVKSEETGRARPLWLPIGLTIPWHYKGSLHRIRIRRQKPVPFGPPYYVVPGSSMGTMIIPCTSTTGWGPRTWMIVESELDAILVHQEAGSICGVMAVGSSSTRPDAEAATLLRDAVHIMVALDNDEAGEKGWIWWKENVRETAWHTVPKGKDPAEAWRAGVNLREWVIAGLPEGLRMMHKQR